MLNWLETWKSGEFSNKLTSQTHTALYHTIYGILEILKYCFNELKMNFVLLGKFQTDSLEDRFGKYRQLAGGQYHISLRQLYESEKRLRVQSLLTLKSSTFGDISVTMFHENIDQLPDEKADISFNPDINIDPSDYEKIEHELPVITYLAGYCCYVAVKKIKCDFCKQKLVLEQELVVKDNYSIIINLSRGGLLFPREKVVEMVSCIYIIFNKLLQGYEADFLNVHNKRGFVTHFVLNYFSKNGFLLEFNGCEIHSSEHVANTIITCTTNTLLKNYCGKTNDRLGKTKKRKLNTLTNK